jgi:hypothetical protein
MRSHGMVLPGLVGLAGLVGLVGLVACGAPSAGPGQPIGPGTPPVPERITPGWYIANFPNCVDFCDDPSRTALWHEVRARPDLRAALVRVIESPITDPWTRVNAILRLGATGQDPAYRYIRDRLDAAAPDDPDAHEWIMAMGSGQGPVPDLVYETLAAQLPVPYRTEVTLFSLGTIGTARARAIMEEAVRATDDRELRESIWRALREWTPRPDREPG